MHPVEGNFSVATSLHQLPPPPKNFTGRKDEIKSLMEAIEKGGVNISSLHGQGGVGKTALALKLAEMIKPLYTDAQFYLDLKGASKQPISAADAMSHVIRAYHPMMKLPEAESELRGLYLSVLHGKRALLLMDNAASREQVEPLIPPEGSVIIVTSRNYFQVDGISARNLDALPPADARELLIKIAPRIESHADEIAKLCCYLPLALKLAASTIAERPNFKPEDYVRRLKDAEQRLRLLKDVDTSLTVSYELLSDDKQKQWRALAVFPDTFDAQAVAAIWEMENDLAHDAISELMKYSLVEWDKTTDRYRLHDLARLFASEKLGEEERYTVGLLHSQRYAKVLAEANSFYYTGGESIKTALDLYDIELINVQIGQSWVVSQAESDEAAARLCIEYPERGYLILGLRQHPRERIEWLQAELTYARQLKERRYEGNALGNLGLAHADLGETRKAIEFYEQYLAIAQEIGYRQGEGIALWNKALALNELGDRKQAIACVEESLRIKEAIEDPFASKVRDKLAEWKSEE